MFLISLRLRRQTLRQLFFFFFCISAEILTRSLPVLTKRASLSLLTKKSFTLKSLVCEAKYVFSSSSDYLSSLFCLHIPAVILTIIHSSVSFIFPAWVINTKSPFHVIILIDKNCYSRGINFKTLTWEARETRLVKQCSSHDPTTSIAVYQVTGSWVGFSLENKKNSRALHYLKESTRSTEFKVLSTRSTELNTC